MIRLFDIVLSGIGLILLSPLFLVLYILIWCESKGGGFYRQERIGKDGVKFNLLKFRSMRTDADEAGLITVGERDTRITRMGHFIRKYKLDELPQLWNVFVGDMSLVGPRPEVEKYTRLYTKEQQRVLSVRPASQTGLLLNILMRMRYWVKPTTQRESISSRLCPIKSAIT